MKLLSTSVPDVEGVVFEFVEPHQKERSDVSSKLSILRRRGVALCHQRANV